MCWETSDCSFLAVLQHVINCCRPQLSLCAKEHKNSFLLSNCTLVAVTCILSGLPFSVSGDLDSGLFFYDINIFGFHQWVRICRYLYPVPDLFYLTRCPLVLSMLCKWQSFLLFYGWIMFHCVDIPHFLQSLIPQWIPYLTPYLSYFASCYHNMGV